ncbi:translation initiation factor IF-2-like [Panthera tigris]|uniref:translation initiation factor IF-2-like n=1 Tax=Panthera tigris TaxID=9694 RepID=UPI001C6F98BE|nr:translation initiation factor IF-2-like [Panthera tigris]
MRSAERKAGGPCLAGEPKPVPPDGAAGVGASRPARLSLDARGRCSPPRRLEEPGWGALTLGEGRGIAEGPGRRDSHRSCAERLVPRPGPGLGRRRSLHRGRPPQPGTDKAPGSAATPGGGGGPSWPESGDEGVPRAGKRGTDLDGAGVLAVVQQPHGAAVLALQAPAAAAHQPAQHLPARPPAPGRDAAALRTPDQAPLSRAAPRGPRAPAPSPQPGRGRCLLLSQLLLLLLLLLRHRLPPAPSKRPALSPPRPTPHAQFVGRGLGRRGANGGQRGGTEWQREEPIEIGY